MSAFTGSIFTSFYSGLLSTPVESAPVDPEAKAEVNDPLSRANILSAFPNYPHFCADSPLPSLPIYRVMRPHPIISFAFGLVANPITAGTRTLVIRNQDGSDAPVRKIASVGRGVQVKESPEDKRKKLAEDVFESLWPSILEGLESLNFGFWLHEVIWDRWMGVTAPVRFKSILPWDVELKRDKFNDFAGFKLNGGDNDDNARDPRYAFHCVCNPHLNPITGWPRTANALMSWWRYLKSHENADRIEKKASGRQMHVELANGKTIVGDDGKPVFTKEESQKLIDGAAQGQVFQTTMFPWTLAAIKQNPDLAKYPAARVTPLDWGDTGPAMLASIERRAELAVEIVRAYNRPEREAMEGKTGTKAEAGVHGQVGITDSELAGAALYGQFNVQVFNRYLATNYGTEAIDSMYWKMGPLSDPDKAEKWNTIRALMTSPVTGPVFTRHIDERGTLKELGVQMIPEDQVPELPPMPTGDEGENGDDEGDDPLAKRNGNGRANARA